MRIIISNNGGGGGGWTKVDNIIFTKNEHSETYISNISNNSALKREQHGIVRFEKYLLLTEIDFQFFFITLQNHDS